MTKTSKYIRTKNTTMGNPQFLINLPQQFNTDKKLRDNSPVTLKVAKNFLFIKDSSTGQSECFNIIISSYNIQDSLKKINDYLNTLNTL